MRTLYNIVLILFIYSLKKEIKEQIYIGQDTVYATF